MSTSQAPFTLRDGENLALYDWPLHPAQRPRAVVLIVHGIGEHAWRYDHVARRLNGWGFCVRAYDQRGHGESGGARGVLPTDHALLADLAEVVDDTRVQLCNPGACPLILLGHSMGGWWPPVLWPVGCARWRAWCCRHLRSIRVSALGRRCSFICCTAWRPT